MRRRLIFTFPDPPIVTSILGHFYISLPQEPPTMAPDARCAVTLYLAPPLCCFLRRRWTFGLPSPANALAQHTLYRYVSHSQPTRLAKHRRYTYPIAIALYCSPSIPLLSTLFVTPTDAYTRQGHRLHSQTRPLQSCKCMHAIAR